jgi:hypothetical protein
MVEVIPFQPGHLDIIEIRPEILSEELDIVKQKRLAFYWAQFPSLTIMDEQRIIACMGGVYLWPRTAESWLRTVPDVYKYKNILIEQINRLTDFCFDVWNLNRLQATVQKDWMVARRFIEHQGYILEGELPYYMGETTYLMYAKLREN